MSESAALESEESGADDEIDRGVGGDEFHAGKIYCANCIQCKLMAAKSEKDGKIGLRIRCAAGKWKKKLGEEKLYKYNTITRRYLDSCDSYDEMGDTREFIRELRKNLANKDDIYTLWDEEEEVPNPA